LEPCSRDTGGSSVAIASKRAGEPITCPWIRYSITTGCIGLLLGLVNPYYIVLVVSVTVVWAVCSWFRNRDMTSVHLAAGPVGGCMIACLQYAGQPVSGNLGSISLDDPVGPVDFLLFFMPLLVGAVLGFFLMCQK
jgi:hypothetical protein